MFFILATYSIAAVYSSNSQTPLYYLRNLHYSSLSDVSWFGSNSFAICSIDGFITFVQLPMEKMGKMIEQSLPVQKEEVRNEEVPEEEKKQEVFYKNGQKYIKPMQVE